LRPENGGFRGKVLAFDYCISPVRQQPPTCPTVRESSITYDAMASKRRAPRRVARCFSHSLVGGRSSPANTAPVPYSCASESLGSPNADGPPFAPLACHGLRVWRFIDACVESTILEARVGVSTPYRRYVRYTDDGRGIDECLNCQSRPWEWRGGSGIVRFCTYCGIELSGQKSGRSVRQRVNGRR
jgi:hypothetical protein